MDKDENTFKDRKLEDHILILKEMFIKHFGDVNIDSEPFIEKNQMYMFMLKYKKIYEEDASILLKVRELMEDILKRLEEMKEDDDTIPMLKELGDDYHLTREFKVHVDYLLKLYGVVVEIL